MINDNVTAQGANGVPKPGQTDAQASAATPAGRQGEPQNGSNESGVSRQAFGRYLENVLTASHIKDYCPNGLQVEGAGRVGRVVSGVTASLALIRAAVAAKADTLLVHHGYFWRGEDPRLIGPARQRIALLLQHNINLFAYHLPLDLHPDLGNNAQLANLLGWPVTGQGGDRNLIFYGDLPAPQSARQVADLLSRRLDRQPLMVGDLDRPINRIAWCTGGAQDALSEAIELGADAYVSGEISERTTHLARESGVVYFAAGHHATERYGVQALGAFVSEKLGVEHRYIDDPNPV